MTRPHIRCAVLAAVVSVALFAAGCSEPEPETTSGTDDSSADSSTNSASDCAGDLLVECARASTIAELVPETPEAADGEPFTIGMVNQENTPAGSYPELSQAVQAAVEYVNTQLGGLDGRPIEVDVCNTEFSAEGSTACGQRFAEQGTPVVLGGIDVFGNAIDVLADNDVPYVGGIPISTQSVQAENSYQWSGGTWGAAVAFAEHAATELGAEKVAVVYGEFGSITQGAEYAKKVLEGHGVQAQLVPFPIVATDLISPMQAAASSEPDAIIVLAADAGCRAGFEAIQTIGLEAQKYFVGACAAPAILDSVDPAATEGTIFNVEGPISSSSPDPDVTFYNGVIEQYGDGLDPVGAGTVSFRSFMNLYSILRELGVDGSTPSAIGERLAAQRDAPSFMGHDYTCDREQFEGLPAMCSPQQILGQREDGELTQLGSWIDVGAIYAG